MICRIFLITLQILTLLQRMNNERRDMYHDLVCEHQKLSNEHNKLCLDLKKKGKPSWHIFMCRITFTFYFSIFFLPTHLNVPTHNSLLTFFSHCWGTSHRACQEGEGAHRYARPCKLPNNLFALQILLSLSLSSIFKSFLILLTSNPCRW
jgi:hypothetical protein